MASTYSNTKIQLMAAGENSTTWGNVTNDNWKAVEEMVVGSSDVTFANANVSITLTSSNATQSARHMRLNLTGSTGGSTRYLTIPSIEKLYIVNNSCDDDVVVTNGSGDTLTVPAGKSMWVYNDGTNVSEVVTYLSSLSSQGYPRCSFRRHGF